MVLAVCGTQTVSVNVSLRDSHDTECWAVSGYVAWPMYKPTPKALAPKFNPKLSAYMWVYMVSTHSCITRKQFLCCTYDTPSVLRSGIFIVTLWVLEISWIRWPFGPMMLPWCLRGTTHSSVTWASYIRNSHKMHIIFMIQWSHMRHDSIISRVHCSDWDLDDSKPAKNKHWQRQISSGLALSTS